MSAEHESKEDRTARKDRPASAAAPFPPERPDDDQRPVSQKEGEARAAQAAMAGEHGTEGPPQYLDAPEPEGHNAGDYSIAGDETKDKTKGNGKGSSSEDETDSSGSKDKGSAFGPSSS